ncbi:hypothetical protein AB6896_01805 [Rahnella inusitata]|uniref:hypothetical protein n=1 Tax=Rahnella inusitata TaxID=58169 RepID=UPI0039BEB966
MNIKWEYAKNMQPYEHVVKAAVCEELYGALKKAELVVRKLCADGSTKSMALSAAQSAIDKALGQ